MISVKPPPQPGPKITGRDGYPYRFAPPDNERMNRVKAMMVLVQQHTQMGIPVDKLMEAIKYELKELGIV